MSNQITCKKTGLGLAMKTGGGSCVCPSADRCRMAQGPLSATDIVWNEAIDAAAHAAETRTPRGTCSESFEWGQTASVEAIRLLKRMPS